MTTSRRKLRSSLATALAYYFFILIADMFNEKPGLYPHVLMWVPNVLFLGIGGWLFYKLSRK